MINIDSIVLKEEKEFVDLKINKQITLQIKQYLPIAEKMDFLTSVLNEVINGLEEGEGLNFINPLLLRYSFEMNIVSYFSDLDLSASDKYKDKLDMYDLLKRSEVIKKIINAIPSEEYIYLEDITYELIDAFEKFRGSALGILAALKENKSLEDLELDKTLENLEKIKNHEDELGLLKDILQNYGA